MENNGPPSPAITSRAETVFVLLATLYLGLTLSWWCLEDVHRGLGGRKGGSKGGPRCGFQATVQPGPCLNRECVGGTSEGLFPVGVSQGSGSRKASLLFCGACPCLLSVPTLTSNPRKREMSEGERKKD